MRRILSLQGGMAAGKTTLAKRLKKRLKKDVTFMYENHYPVVEKRKKLNLDIYKEKDFITNQKLFIEAEIERFNQLPQGNIIFDRGPEDVEFYTLYFPKAFGQDWNVKEQLKDELQELRKCRSDVILYLDASVQTLYERKQSDMTRKRNSFEQNMKLYPYEKEWFQQFHTYFVNVDEKSLHEIEKWTLAFLREMKFI
jgi:deoxyadenosine/deoxycytidine kinase